MCDPISEISPMCRTCVILALEPTLPQAPGFTQGEADGSVSQELSRMSDAIMPNGKPAFIIPNCEVR